MLKKRIIIGAYIFLFVLMCILLIVFTLTSGKSDMIKTSLFLFVGIIVFTIGTYKFVEIAKKELKNDDKKDDEDGQL